MTYYKIVKLKETGIYTLFHGFNGKKKRTKKLPFGEWIEAEVKIVRDGSNSKEYESGFHILPDYKTAKEYKKRFKQKKLAIIPVKAEGVRQKRNSVSLLADKIMIPMDVFYQFLTRE